MTRNHRFVCVLLTLGLLAPLLLGVSPALASELTPVVLQETETFGTNHQPGVAMFTASGIPGCTSGTFSDHLVSFSPSGARVIIDRTYTCAEGGTFTARVALHLQAVDANGEQFATSTWRIISSDGPQASLSGSGKGFGVSTGCSPVGDVFAFCSAATGTTLAYIH